jgi:hypothetical protein
VTFKATIKVGGGEVSTANHDCLTLETPGGHAIGGATAAYAYDRLLDLASKHCMPGTRLGNGHADDMGRALDTVLKKQLAVIERQEKEIASLKRELRAVGAQCEPACNPVPPPAVTKDTPVTLGMLRELHQTSSDLRDAQYWSEREECYQRRVNEARRCGRPGPVRPPFRPLPGSTMVEALDRKLGGR